MFVHPNNHYHVGKAKPILREDNCSSFSIIPPYSQVISDTPSPPPPQAIDWKKCLVQMEEFIEYLETIEVYDEIDSILNIRNNAQALSDLEIDAGFELALVSLKKDEYSEQCKRKRMYAAVIGYCNAERERQNVL